MKGTIKSKEDVERLFQKGRRSSSSFVTILCIDNPLSDSGRCAFIAGKKLGCAPFRNRCKRVMREIAHELGAPFPGYDIAFIARSQIAFLDYVSAIKQVRKQLMKLGVLQ